MAEEQPAEQPLKENIQCRVDVGCDSVDKIEFQRLRGCNGLARQAHLVEHPPGQQMVQNSQNLRRKDPNLDLRQGKRCRFRRDGHVAHGHQSHAARKAGAIDARNNGNGQLPRPAEKISSRHVRIRAVYCKRIAGLQIATGAKRLAARTGQNNRTGTPVVLGAIQSLANAVEHGRTDRVATRILCGWSATEPRRVAR